LNIISASRRTDIPRYFGEWFRARRKAGFAEYRTVFGGGRNGRFRVSLAREDVLGYLFWTRYARPFHDQLLTLRNDRIPYAFQYTITGYGTDYEPGGPGVETQVDDFLGVAESLPGPAAIQWRYDPIVVSAGYGAEWHRRNFRRIAERLRGSTEVVNVSLVEPYLKALTKAPDWRAIRWRRPDPLKHQSVLRRFAELREAGPDELLLLRDLSEEARNNGMELRVCCNAEYQVEHPGAVCCGADLFTAYGEETIRQVALVPRSPSRHGCRCLKSCDLGMDTTCPAGCFYCYVTTSVAAARRNYETHDPEKTMLRR
jgi:hypothetical protein